MWTYSKVWKEIAVRHRMSFINMNFLNNILFHHWHLHLNLQVKRMSGMQVFLTCFPQSLYIVWVACTTPCSIKGLRGDTFGIMSSTFSYVFSNTSLRQSLFSIISIFALSSETGSYHKFRPVKLKLYLYLPFGGGTTVWKNSLLTSFRTVASYRIDTILYN